MAKKPRVPVKGEVVMGILSARQSFGWTIAVRLRSLPNEWTEEEAIAMAWIHLANHLQARGANLYALLDDLPRPT